MPTRLRACKTPSACRLLLACLLGSCSAAGLSVGAFGLISAAPARADPVLAAAGDIACPAGDKNLQHECKQAETANLIASQHPDAVAPLGDNQYESGQLAEYESPGAYNATWGRFNAMAHPVPGNHEYELSSDASGYFEYFRSVLPTAALEDGGYYSYDLGAWHIVALNSNCSDLGCSDLEEGFVTTAELDWLKADLAAHPGQCILAYWHHPAFTSGGTSVPESPGVLPLWEALYAARADVVLAGHDHVYERYAQQSPQGMASSQGIREFVVGTGGQTLFGLGAAQPNLEVADDKHFGVLLLTLHASSYEWVFRAVPGGDALDSGSTRCHSAPPPTPPAPPPPPASPPPPPKPPPKPVRLRFIVHVKAAVYRVALRRGLPAALYCSRACQVRVTWVLVRRRGHLVRKVRYRGPEVTLESAHGEFRLKTRLSVSRGARLTFMFVATAANLERRTASATTLLR